MDCVRYGTAKGRALTKKKVATQTMKPD